MRHVASKLPSTDADYLEQEHVEEVAMIGPNEEERLEHLYEQVAWPLGKQYGHPYDAFKLALTYVVFRSRCCSFHDRPQ